MGLSTQIWKNTWEKFRKCSGKFGSLRSNHFFQLCKDTMVRFWFRKNCGQLSIIFMMMIMAMMNVPSCKCLTQTRMANCNCLRWPSESPSLFIDIFIALVIKLLGHQIYVQKCLKLRVNCQNFREVWHFPIDLRIILSNFVVTGVYALF